MIQIKTWSKHLNVKINIKGHREPESKEQKNFRSFLKEYYPEVNQKVYFVDPEYTEHQIYYYYDVPSTVAGVDRFKSFDRTTISTTERVSFRSDITNSGYNKVVSNESKEFFRNELFNHCFRNFCEQINFGKHIGFISKININQQNQSTVFKDTKIFICTIYYGKLDINKTVSLVEDSNENSIDNWT